MLAMLLVAVTIVEVQIMTADVQSAVQDQALPATTVVLWSASDLLPSYP
jgi:hypothetical protein